MQIPLDLARTLAAVVDAGTFDAAAAELNLTPSAISQRVKQLEHRLGRVLVVRSKPVRVTEAGLQIDPISFKEGALFPRNAHYDRETETWRFVGSGAAILHTPAADTGIYAGRSLGAQNAKTGPNTVWFNSTPASAVSRDRPGSCAPAPEPQCRNSTPARPWAWSSPRAVNAGRSATRAVRHRRPS